MTLVLILFFVFLLAGMPVALPSASLAAFSCRRLLALTMPVQLILSETQLLHCWLFRCLLAGNLLNETGITKLLPQYSLDTCMGSPK